MRWQTANGSGRRSGILGFNPLVAPLLLTLLPLSISKTELLCTATPKNGAGNPAAILILPLPLVPGGEFARRRHAGDIYVLRSISINLKLRVFLIVFLVLYVKIYSFHYRIEI